MRKQDVKTLADSHIYNREHWEEGVKCLSCGQNIKLYKRKIYSTMARNLINLYKLHTSEFTHIGDFCPKHPGDFAKLLYWDLVEEQANLDTFKRTSGFWRITENGKQFVENVLSVREYAKVYNGIFVGFEGDMIKIQDALGKDFDYKELMKA